LTHYSDDDLILHYYGDAEAPGGIARHLTVCSDCGGRYRELSESLRRLTFAAPPELGDRYGLELWHRIAPRLPERERFWHVSWFRPLSVAAAAVVLLVVGFTAGRVAPAGGDRPVTASRTIDAGQARRVLLLSVADHLERSDRVLTDIVNASADGDISAAQQWAEDLVSANRFYRQDAVASEERSVAAVLDELERALLDIVHSPSRVTQADLEQVHRRLDSAALVFKVRVLSGELRQRQLESAEPSSSEPSPSRIS
jgi:hypothetical protein